MKRVTRWSTLVPLLVAGAAMNLSDHGPTKPPAGRSIQNPSTLTLNQDGYKFEIHLDPSAGNVSVYTLSAPQPLPRSMSFSILRDPTTGQTYELHAIEPRMTDKPGELPKYAGNIDFNSGSYVGLEIQVPLPSGEWKRLRAENRPTS